MAIWANLGNTLEQWGARGGTHADVKAGGLEACLAGAGMDVARSVACLGSWIGEQRSTIFGHRPTVAGRADQSSWLPLLCDVRARSFEGV